jgi:hypothetical protein
MNPYMNPRLPGLGLAPELDTPHIDPRMLDALRRDEAPVETQSLSDRLGTVLPLRRSESHREIGRAAATPMARECEGQAVA